MPWELKRERYMTLEEVKKLRKSTEDKSLADLAKGRETWVRYWAVIDLASQTGLRCSELTNLNVGDLELKGSTPHLTVVGGKGRKQGVDRDTVTLSRRLVRHLRSYIKWKDLSGEITLSDAPLFVTKRRGRFSTRAMQMLFKRACAEAGLPAHYSIHALRHSWGTYLYQKTKNLRLVQKELRHRNIQTTTVYADVTPEEASEAVNGVWDD
jgi:site-specific recombinase XerD